MTWPTVPAWCVVVDHGDAALILDRRTGGLHRLDPVGTLLVRERSRWEDLADAVDDIADVFALDRSDAARHLHDFEAMLDRAVDLEVGGDRASFASILSNSPASTTTGRGPARLETTIDALGVVADVRVHDPALGPIVEPLLASLRTDAHATHTIHLSTSLGQIALELDGRTVVETTSVEHAIAELLAVVTLMPTAVPRPELLLHAGSVEIDGGVVLMAGPSNHGKSSTTLALVHAGARYLSDDVTAVDLDTGRATGLPRPIALKGPVRDLYPDLRPTWCGEVDRWQVPVPPADVCRGGPIRGLALLSRSSAPSTATDARADPLTVLQRLTPLIFNLTDVDRPRLEALIDWAARVPVLDVHQSDSRSGADTIGRWAAELRR